MTKKFNHPLMVNNITRSDRYVAASFIKNNTVFTQSKKVIEFEKQWSKWLGVKYSVFVNSGASSNLLTMANLKLRYTEGGEVIVPPLTWVSDIASVIQSGFTPVFVDVDPNTLAIDTNLVLNAITKNTRAVFLTHVQGFNGLTESLLEVLKQKNIPLIEDVCESHGATHNEKKLGTYGWISNFSFYYAHHMSTIEGGMICTNDQNVYQQARMLRSHGMVRELTDSNLRKSYQEANSSLNPDFIFAYPAFNVRNTEIGGILGRSQLKRLDANIIQRKKNLVRFLNQIDSSIYQTEFKIEGSSNYAFNLILLYPDLLLLNRLVTKMKNNGVEFRRGSAGGGNQLRQPYLKNYLPVDYHLSFPNVEHIHFYGFYIGNFPDLQDFEIDTICEIVNSAKYP
jgi:CDP-6-deoxy-D-xylo-4-hexulose-3-dehydrase